ncbi:hypothetical protein RB595_010713 [Gaeumannomyces hyphopodioides]
MVTNINDVRGHLHLPKTWDGLPVRWASSDPTVVGHDGLVKRREDGHRHVTLRATIEHGGVSVERKFTARVRQAVKKPQASNYEGYAFSYFTGNSIAGEKIYFAASVGNDALNWRELNRGQPVLTSTMGTKGLRDPFLIRSPEGDTFYLIATDLSIGSGTSWGDVVRFGSLFLEVWESHDLVNWSAQRHIKVSPPSAGNTWAPEAYYDPSIGAYAVFWASSLYAGNDTRRNGPTYHRMLYATTRDFVTFSNTTYHRFTKDEGAGSTGCVDIIQERSSSLEARLPSWTREAACIGRNAGTQAVEGPIVFKSNPGDVHGDKFYLFVNEYGGRGYVPLETADISNPKWKLSSSWNLPASPRHGTVVPITKAELARLTGSTGQPKPANAAGEIGGATIRNGALVLDGVDDYVTLPSDLVAGVEDITIEAEVQLATDQQTPYFIFGIGNTGSSGAGAGYLFATGSPYRASITLTDYTAEQTVSLGQELPRGQWVHLAYVNLDPARIGGGATNNNFIGKSTYTSDRLLKGQVRKFAVYNRALSAAEVLTSPLVSGSGRSVLFYVKPGTNLAALAPTFTTPDGVTASPAPGVTVDFSKGRTVTYTLTNRGDGTSATWAITAREMASPVLPGLYADPNIYIYNATYYIYATTDGFPGWGGKEFYVLDGANGNLPWAVGNAWAPGFIERGGKFYFYHSGHHIRLNTKTIGAAVASHPLGPFTAQPDAMIFNNETVTSGQAIDPAAFHDPVSGKYYLYWGNGRPLYAQLADDMVSLVPGATKQISGLNDFREGLFLVHRRGLYHLTYSIDDTGFEDYRVGYATATSPDGPWTYRGVVLTKRPELGILGTGHNSMAQVPGTDDWVIVYYRFGIPGGNGNNRETTIDRVVFDEQTGFMKTITPTLKSVSAQRITSGALR